MKLRRHGNHTRGDMVVLIGIGVLLCVVLLGGILGTLVRNGRDTAAVETPPADGTIIDPDDLVIDDPADDDLSMDETEPATPPEQGFNGFAVTLSCVEDPRVWLDVQNPHELAHEYRFTVNGDEVEVQADDFTSHQGHGRANGTSAFEFEKVLARYFAEHVSSNGNHRRRPWNVRLTAVLTESQQSYDPWYVRDLVFHDYDLSVEELKPSLSRYDEAKPGQPARMYVEFESSRTGRTTCLLRYEGGETFAQKVPTTNVHWAYLNGYAYDNAEEDAPRVCLVIDGREVPIGGETTTGNQGDTDDVDESEETDDNEQEEVEKKAKRLHAD